MLLNATRGHAFPINCTQEDRGDTEGMSARLWRIRKAGNDGWPFGRTDSHSVKSLRKTQAVFKLLKNNKVYGTAILGDFQRLFKVLLVAVSLLPTT